jgi:hypothetical protein
MKAAEIFKQYIWLLDAIYRAGCISLNELNRRWVRTEMSGGVPMARTTFNRHREAIEDIFDLCIECKRKGSEYLYFIENREVLEDDNLQHWMLDSLCISNLLMECGGLKDRIVLENIPAGREHLQTIIQAMKLNRRLLMCYRKFGQQQGYDIVVEPYAIKVFKQRWYLLAKNNKRELPSIYALDRIVRMEETAEGFVFPQDFATEVFFKDWYGVLCDANVKAERVVIRAYCPLDSYLRTLPLHHSQREVCAKEGYADFELFLNPTFDFVQELLAQGHELEVLQPSSLRMQMKEMVARMMSRYGEGD